MAEGTVRWFGGKRPDGKTRGYGFILQDSGEEIFVHYSEIEKDKEGFKTLREGQRVTFEVGEGQDGKAQAMDVRVIGEAEQAAPAPGSDAVSAAEAVAAAAVPGAEYAGVGEDVVAAEEPVAFDNDNDGDSDDDDTADDDSDDDDDKDDDDSDED